MILEYIHALNENVKSLTEKLNSRDEKVSTLEVTLNKCQEEIQCKFSILLYVVCLKEPYSKQRNIDKNGKETSPM